MKHRISGRKLGRDRQERKALFRSLIISLIRHGRIETTLAKAKAIRPMAEKLIMLAKKNSLSSNRKIQSVIQDARMTGKLVSEIAPSLTGGSGFIKIDKISIRKGDAATVAGISLINSKQIEPEKK